MSVAHLGAPCLLMMTATPSSTGTLASARGWRGAEPPRAPDLVEQFELLGDDFNSEMLATPAQGELDFFVNDSQNLSSDAYGSLFDQGLTLPGEETNAYATTANW